LLTLQPIYKPKDELAEAYVSDLINKYLDGRYKPLRDNYADVITVLSSLLAYQGAKRFKVQRKLLTKSQAIAWDVIRKGLMGVLLTRESGTNEYSVKTDVIPPEVFVINSTQRGINYRLEGKGVHWTNLMDAEPELVSLICGVRAAKIELLSVDLTFEHLLRDRNLPIRWTFNTDLEALSISEEAVALADTFTEWLNNLFQRHGYIMGVKRLDGAISLVCAADIVPNLQDLLANLTLRFFQAQKLKQVSFPMHISSGGLTSFLHGRPLTQLRMEMVS
jgi:hypothetical protein